MRPSTASVVEDASTDRLRAALSSRTSQGKEVEAWRFRALEAQSEVTSTDRRIKAMVKAYADRAAEAYATGDDPPTENPDDRAELKRLRANAATAEHAGPLIAQKIAEAETDLAAISQDVADAFFDWKAARQEGLLEVVGVLLGQLQAPLAELAAIGVLQDELLGTKFRVSCLDHPGLAAGGSYAKALIQSLPDALRPSAMRTEEFARTTATIARALLESLEGTQA